MESANGILPKPAHRYILIASLDLIPSTLFSRDRQHYASREGIEKKNVAYPGSDGGGGN